MSRRFRAALLGVGLAGFGVLLVAALLAAPPSGRESHPYGDATVANAVTTQKTPNVISSINFDQRGFDTLGEEFLLFASVLGAVVLLRPRPGAKQVEVADAPEPLDAVRALGVLLLPVVVLVGFYVVATGHLSVGGGFQGGVIIATGIHLLFLAGDYPALRRVRPLPLVDVDDVVGAVGYIAVGLIGVAMGGAFLENTMPHGIFNTLFSAGTVDLLNVTIGIEVASGMILLLGEFLEQALGPGTGSGSGSGSGTSGADA
jgi:multicomponent Na+:H+ antiporter subunit B